MITETLLLGRAHEDMARRSKRTVVNTSVQTVDRVKDSFVEKETARTTTNGGLQQDMARGGQVNV